MNAHLSSMNANFPSGFFVMLTTGSMPGTLEPGKAAVRALLKMALSCSSVTLGGQGRNWIKPIPSKIYLLHSFLCYDGVFAF